VKEERKVELNVVLAIVPAIQLSTVEKKLQELCVVGITVTKARGYGEYANYFTPDWLSDQARIEVFADSGHAEAIAQAIIDAGHTGNASDGIVAILPVRKAYSIKTRSETIPNRS
jgi:nitrogen regulatory protein P-II 1